MIDQSIKVIINSPYFQAESADLMARQSDVQVVVLATSVDAFDSIKTYYDLFDYNIDHIIKVLKQGS